MLIGAWPVASMIVAVFVSSCAPTEQLATTPSTVKSPGIELAIVATYSSLSRDSVAPFEYDKANRRSIRVIDMGVEECGPNRRSLRLTLDASTALQLGDSFPHNVNCDLGLVIDREVIALLHARTPVGDVLYVDEDIAWPREVLDSIEVRIRAASHLGVDAEYVPSLDATSWIELERRACLQRCPQYTVRVHGDGVITYTGSSGVSRVGRRDGAISAAAVRRLFARFAAARFFELPDESVTSRDDLLPSTLTLSVRGRTKRCVRHTERPSSAVDQAPTAGSALDLLANAVDLEAQSRRWVGKSDCRPRPMITRDTTYTTKDPNSFEIRFKRGGVFTSPIYEISIRSDGAVKYRGIEDVVVLGEAATSIAPTMVEEIVDRLQLMSFWQLEDAYRTGAMDSPGKAITLSIDGRAKTVVSDWSEALGSELANASIHRELDAVALAIDAAVDAQAWFAPNDVIWNRELDARACIHR